MNGMGLTPGFREERQAQSSETQSLNSLKMMTRVSPSVLSEFWKCSLTTSSSFSILG